MVVASRLASLTSDAKALSGGEILEVVTILLLLRGLLLLMVAAPGVESSSAKATKADPLECDR